jgi:acyl dehydratase
MSGPRELSSSPSLAGSYARAVLGLLPGGGDELPDHALALPEIAVDRDRLAAYSRVCGFGLRDELPPTYLHILAFPLAMRLMTERSFPFPLVGLVHVANRIEQLRPVEVAERPALTVRAERLRPHRRGRQFDLVTEARADGELAWREHSTYLRRGGGAQQGGEGERSDGGDAPPESEEPESEPAAEGHEEEPPRGEEVAVWDVPGDIGRRYAEVSGDRNPIHLHPLSARAFGFPGAIAHGMWMKARALASFEGRLPPSLTAEVEFRAPLRIPARAVLRSAPAESGWRFALTGKDGERTHLEGSIRADA